jgi:hypothetical protein
MRAIPNNLHDSVKESVSSGDLIDALEQSVPHCHPTRDMTERDIWIAVGKRELVMTLSQIRKSLEENI